MATITAKRTLTANLFATCFAVSKKWLFHLIFLLDWINFNLIGIINLFPFITVPTQILGLSGQ